MMGHILIVTGGRHQAANAGCGLTLKHRGDRQVHFWWHELGHDCLVGKQFEQVIICPTVIHKKDIDWLRANQPHATLIRL